MTGAEHEQLAQAALRPLLMLGWLAFGLAFALRATFGKAFGDYARRVPAVLPHLWRGGG